MDGCGFCCRWVSISLVFRFGVGYEDLDYFTFPQTRLTHRLHVTFPATVAKLTCILVCFYPPPIDRSLRFVLFRTDLHLLLDTYGQCLANTLTLVADYRIDETSNCLSIHSCPSVLLHGIVIFLGLVKYPSYFSFLHPFS